MNGIIDRWRTRRLASMQSRIIDVVTENPGICLGGLYRRVSGMFSECTYRKSVWDMWGAGALVLGGQCEHKKHSFDYAWFKYWMNAGTTVTYVPDGDQEPVESGIEIIMPGVEE